MASRLVVVFALVALSSGCGSASSESNGPHVTLRVTRDFGHEVLSSGTLPLAGHRTPVQLLREDHEVLLDEDVGAVLSIDGLAQTDPTEVGEHEHDWVVNVNGIETDLPSTQLPLKAGDVVQFDYRDWYVTLDVRATVGAFPATFVNGMIGSTFPVRVRCAPGYDRTCGVVRDSLRSGGVDLARRRATVPPHRMGRTLPRIRRSVVFVGPWNRWRDHPWSARIDEGPEYSGVFARFNARGTTVRLLDWNESVVDTAGRGTGLVAAMKPSTYDLYWYVTGVDREGVQRAAAALDDLEDAFAVAVTDDGVMKLPLKPKR